MAKQFVFVLFTSIFIGFIACSSPTKSKKDAPPMVQLSGNFSSKKGVMDVLSCHCYNGGYLTDGSGKRVAVCFDDNQNIACTNLTLTGFYTTHTNKPEPTSPCKAGELAYFKVVSFTCR
jgi:hypothetical protein